MHRIEDDSIKQFETPTSSITIDGKIINAKISHLPKFREIDLTLYLEKEPTVMPEGHFVEHTYIDFDTSNEPKLLEFRKKLSGINQLPNKQKPRAIVDLLRSQVDFAYKDVVEADGSLTAEEKQYILRNLFHTFKDVQLSEIFKYGYGVCRTLSMACLKSANECGLNCRYMSNCGYVIKNAFNTRAGKHMFRLSAADQIIEAGHAWVEFETAPGVWVPADPSTKIIGDNPEDLQYFKDANYQSEVGYCDWITLADEIPMQTPPIKQCQYNFCGNEYSQTFRFTPLRGYSGPVSISINRGRTHNAFPIVDKMIDAKLDIVPATEQYFKYLQEDQEILTF